MSSANEQFCACQLFTNPRRRSEVQVNDDSDSSIVGTRGFSDAFAYELTFELY